MVQVLRAGRIQKGFKMKDLNINKSQALLNEREDFKSMKRILDALFLGFVLLLAICSLTQQAQATLGESVDSAMTNKKSLSAVRSATTKSLKYTVYESQYDTITIREYASSSGIVFGIVWIGLTHPDLTPLLGSYASEYKKALSQVKRQPGSKHVKVKTENVVVEKWGHMRKLQGRAYAPDLIPEGVSIEEIK